MLTLIKTILKYNNKFNKPGKCFINFYFLIFNIIKLHYLKNFIETDIYISFLGSFAISHLSVYFKIIFNKKKKRILYS